MPLEGKSKRMMPWLPSDKAAQTGQLKQVSLLSQQTSLPCGPGRAFLAGSVVLAPGWRAVDIW